MKYLLDSDTFIRANNDYYDTEMVPGFWSALEKLNKEGVVFSLDAVKRELDEEDDWISRWATMRGSGFFLRRDAEAAKTMRTLAVWIQTNEQYTDAAKREFMDGADFSLVGFAMAHPFTIVTLETDQPNSISRIKIPSICKHFNVDCINLKTMIKRLGVKLILAN